MSLLEISTKLNAGNFQEYPYETEWLECEWKKVHKTLWLVSAYYYPWLGFTNEKI